MEILEATPEEFDAIVALFKKYRFALQSRDWYNWKYFRNPMGAARPFKITVGGKIVGAVAVMPQRFTYRGRQITGVQTVDGLLGMEIRGKGNFNHLMHFLTVQKPPEVHEECFYLSFPSLAASVKAHQNAGWQRIANFSMLSCLLTPAPLFKKKQLPTLRKALEIPWSIFRRLLFGQAQNSVTIKSAVGLSTDFNELIDASKVSGVRTSDFMKWRVEDNPRDQIRTLLILDQDNFVGYAVCKSAGSAVEVTEIRLNEPKKIYINTLLKHIYTQSWGTSVDFWHFGKSAINRALPKIGFFQRNFTGALFVSNVAPLGLPTASTEWDITYLDSDW